jgi:hypothetical protein
MAKQTINIGASPNDGTGTPLRTAFDYTNQNFTELYTATGPSGNNIVVPGSATITGDLTVDTNTLYVNSSANRVLIGTLTALGSATLSIAGKTQADTAVAGDVIGNFNNTSATGYGLRIGGGSATGGYALSVNNNAGSEFHQISGTGIATWSNVGGVAGTAMTLNSTGLGVGDAPAANSRLTIGSTNATGFQYALRTTGITTGRSQIYLVNTSGDLAAGIEGSTAGASVTGSAAYSAYIGTATSNPFYLVTGGTVRATVDTSGNVGIGVTPSAWASAWRANEVQRAGNALISNAVNSMGLTSNAYLDNVGWKYGATGTANFLAVGNGNGSLAFYQAPSGTAGSAITFTQAMTLDASGNLHVGTTAYVGVASNVINSLSGFNLVPNNTGNAANRNWQLAANGSAAGNLDFTVSSANNTYPNFAYRMQLTSAGALNNTTGTYGTISDLRLKENISDARNYLADLLKLRVVKYSLKEEASAVATKLGFIAQEVEQVFPSLVDQSDKEYEGAEGIRSVKTSILIPMLLKAIQELTARVQTLETR